MQEQTPPAPGGFNQTPMQHYVRNEGNAENYSSSQFAAQILSQPVVTNMAVQYGNALVGSGKQHFEKYVPVRALKYYFAVDTNYVFGKLAILFFPFTHKVRFKIVQRQGIFNQLFNV